MKQQRGKTGFNENHPTTALSSTNVSTQETRGPSFQTQPKLNSSATDLHATQEPGRPSTVVAQDRQAAHTKPNFATTIPHYQPPTPAHTPPTSSRVDDDCTPAEHTSKIRWNTRHPPYRAWSTQRGKRGNAHADDFSPQGRNQQPCDRTTLGWVADGSRTKAPNRERNRGGRSAADDKRDLKADTRTVIIAATQERTVTSNIYSYDYAHTTALILSLQIPPLLADAKGCVGGGGTGQHALTTRPAHLNHPSRFRGGKTELDKHCPQPF